MDRHESEMEGLQFTARKIKWFDEDLKKMETMTVEERLEYKRQLREKGQYTYEDP
ncbi:hypothetical protein IJ732_07395 [bacterium]|nr:hypothetical protein [bacterium]